MKTKDQLLVSFDNYRASVAEALEGVRNLMAAERYDDAAKLMTNVSTAQAQMSIRVQGAMQKLEEARV